MPYCPIAKEKVVYLDCLDCEHKQSDCKKPEEVWIGVDQSYTDTGIAVVRGGKVVYVGDVNFKGCADRYEKRLQLVSKLEGIILKLKTKYAVSVNIEAVRLFSGSQPHISTQYIFATCALVGIIVDVCRKHSVPVYWVETRSWKKAILGRSKPTGRKLAGVKDKNKVDAIMYCIALGLKDKISYVVKCGKNKGQIKYNDNRADAVCIALCGALHKDKIKNIEDF